MYRGGRRVREQHARIALVAFRRGRSVLDTFPAGGPLAAFTAAWEGVKMGKGCWRTVASRGRVRRVY